MVMLNRRSPRDPSLLVVPLPALGTRVPLRRPARRIVNKEATTVNEGIGAVKFVYHSVVRVVLDRMISAYTGVCLKAQVTACFVTR